jgi:hypothetical protein
MTEILTFQVFNDDGSVTLEKTKFVELPKTFDSVEDFISFLNCAFLGSENKSVSDGLDSIDQYENQTIEIDYFLNGHKDHYFH